ncbi:hypothetical protein HUW62_01985 [Myxococcus sp. AM011]|uniref:hypothetical protein n=1 Tax=Myxococcus sp. AM011 TaxID=2745200 RepID=UPI001595C397|nr:hypothetical protein [Myxococcus sp. AM011]NVJ20008.1 hypothetical protein [Myxococcus sp. AM011]
MAAPREVPIILGVLIAVATVMTHTVAGLLDVSAPRPSGPRVAVLAGSPRVPSLSDFVAMVGVGALGLVAIAAQVRSRRARLREAQTGVGPLTGDGPPASVTRGLPASERRTLAWRTGLVLVEWAGFATLSMAFMLRRPPEEWPFFLVPCVLLLPPARVYVRYREGEALWAPWLLALSVLVLGVTREPRCTWGLLLIAGVCQFCVLRQEHARRGVRGTPSRA